MSYRFTGLASITCAHKERKKRVWFCLFVFYLFKLIKNKILLLLQFNDFLEANHRIFVQLLRLCVCVSACVIAARLNFYFEDVVFADTTRNISVVFTCLQ